MVVVLWDAKHDAAVDRERLEDDVVAVAVLVRESRADREPEIVLPVAFDASPDRPVLAARIHDLARNDGWASGGVTPQVDAVIGAGWRLSPKPNARSLKIDPDVASDLASDFEAAWKDFAEDPDSGRRLSMGGLLALAFRHRLWTAKRSRSFCGFPGAGDTPPPVQVINPDRLSNPYDAIDTYCAGRGSNSASTASRWPTTPALASQRPIAH